jgi:hypothetical protein
VARSQSGLLATGLGLLSPRHVSLLVFHSQLAKQLSTAQTLSYILADDIHAPDEVILADDSSSLSVRQKFDSLFQVFGPCFVGSVQIRKFLNREFGNVFQPCSCHNTSLDASAPDFGSVNLARCHLFVFEHEVCLSNEPIDNP